MDKRHSSHGRKANVRNAVCDYSVYTDRKSTIVQVNLDLVYPGDDNRMNVETYVGCGSSRRVAEDSYDERTGNLLALYRALQHVTAELKKEVDKIH